MQIEEGSGTATGISPLPVPEDWQIVTLDDLFEIQQGKALSPKAKLGKSPNSFLRTANVLWGRIDVSNLDWMDFSDDELQKLSLMPGDLLVCEGGDVGRTAIWRGEVKSCAYQNHLHRLRARTDEVEPEFYMYWMQAALTLLGLYGGVGNKTTIPNLSKRRLGRLEVPRPPLDEQRRIAQVLSTIQRAIEAQEKVIAAARELKRSLMRHLFTYGPVPVTETDHVPLKETEIGPIPEHWQVKPLGDISKLLSGGTPSKKRHDWWHGDIPWASSKDLKVSRLSDTQDHISSEAAESGSRIVNAGTLLLAIRGMALAKDIPVALTTVPMAFNQDLKAIVPNEPADAEYLLYAIQQGKRRLAPEVGSSAHGTRRLGTDAVARLKLPLPPATGRQEIVRTLLLLERKAESEDKRRSALQALFKSTLHHLMTGKIRVPAAEGLVEAVVMEADSGNASSRAPEPFQKATLIAALVSEQEKTSRKPVSRLRYEKLSYFYYRKVGNEEALEQYGRHAAGPYNPALRYRGPEGIAIKNKYLVPEGKTHFRSGPVIDEALKYAPRYHSQQTIKAIVELLAPLDDAQLELLASIDATARALRKAGKPVTPKAVQQEWQSHPVWWRKSRKFPIQRIEKALKYWQESVLPSD